MNPGTSYLELLLCCPHYLLPLVWVSIGISDPYLLTVMQGCSDVL